MALSKFSSQGAKLLVRHWKAIQRRDGSLSEYDVPGEIRDAIRRSINCKTKTYRYVLPTQLLAKLVDPELDCRALQQSGGSAGAFDARSFCSKVIAPFDSENHNVLGGSGDPYVSNPLRQSRFSPETRKAHRDKCGFDDIYEVLSYAQANPETVQSLFELALIAVRERLSNVHIIYPVPNRASHKQVTGVVSGFLGKRSGGARLQVISHALLRSVGCHLRLFDSVVSANINAADSQTGKAADLECISKQGEVVLAVEVKDRQLTLRSVQEKLPKSRERGIRELLFLVQGGIETSDAGEVEATMEREFTTGQNVYVCEFNDFLNACLVLFGEKGRRKFLVAVGECLDEAKADLTHRQSWQELLQSL